MSSISRLISAAKLGVMRASSLFAGKPTLNVAVDEAWLSREMLHHLIIERMVELNLINEIPEPQEVNEL